MSAISPARPRLAIDHITLISRTAAVLVAVLAALAFILSYNSLQHLAAGNGIPGRLSYLWPLLLDFAMVVFSLAILRANLRSEPAWYPWALTVAFAALATVANVLDVTALGIPAVAIAAAVKALAPIALVLAFELLMQMIRAEIRRGDLVTSLAELRTQAAQLAAGLEAARQSAAAEQEQLGRQISQQQAKLEALRAEVRSETRGKFAPSIQEMNAARAAKIDQRRQDLLALLPEKLTRAELAQRLGVSEKTVRQDLRALNGAARAVAGGQNA